MTSVLLQNPLGLQVTPRPVGHADEGSATPFSTASGSRFSCLKSRATLLQRSDIFKPLRLDVNKVIDLPNAFRRPGTFEFQALDGYSSRSKGAHLSASSSQDPETSKSVRNCERCTPLLSFDYRRSLYYEMACTDWIDIVFPFFFAEAHWLCLCVLMPHK